MSLERARAKAADAIARAAIDDASPFAASEALSKALVGAETNDDARLAFWKQRVPGTRVGDDRYRWEISHRRCKGGAHVPPREEWRLLRPDVEREVDELRISLPISIADGCEYLARLADAGNADAQALLVEAEPLFRRDLATYVQAQNAWSDTLALRCVAARPRALERLRPLATAIAATYAPLVELGADGGFILGTRFPLAGRPLVSATAHLASGLLALGQDLPLLGKLLVTVREAQHENGSFGDDMPDRFLERYGRDNALTTVACAEILGALDPSFDLARSAAWLASTQRPDGLVMAFGPELVWLTAEFVRLADAAARPFAERFRFPQVERANLDRKTGLPFFAFFDDLARLFSELPGLAGADVPVAFLDLAGFGVFNNAFGQDTGDGVLASLASELAKIPFARAIRDGGDEFIVVGAPCRAALDRDLETFRAAWPARFQADFGKDVPTVAPRVLWTAAPGRDLRKAREALGRGMSAVKDANKNPPPGGVLARL